jgi:hypothetical protein
VTRPAHSVSRRAVLRGLLIAPALAIPACGSAAPDTLDDAVDRLVDQLDPDGPYRQPTPSERDRATAAVDLLSSATTATANATAETFAVLGMTVAAGFDVPAGRRYALAASQFDSDRSWGLLAVVLTDAPPEFLVEVPHPGSDRNTERLGLALFRQLPRAALLVAGAHRSAAGGAADVAHQPDSMFHALATHLAERGATQLQLHGFHDDSLADHAIVISAGAGPPDRRIEETAETLVDAGFDVCRAWERRCGNLEGRTNAQGRAAAMRGYPFLHLEINRSTRDDAERSAALVHALATEFR